MYRVSDSVARALQSITMERNVKPRVIMSDKHAAYNGPMFMDLPNENNNTH